MRNSKLSGGRLVCLSLGRRRYVVILPYLALLVGLLTLACGAQADGAGPQATGMGILAGRITAWPQSPVQGPGISSAATPVPGVKLVISEPSRQEITQVLTDAQGQYRVNLPPGTYRIEMAYGQGRGFSKDLPATVIITPGRETRLDLRLDTGIR
jgi:hypothetical protein